MTGITPISVTVEDEAVLTALQSLAQGRKGAIAACLAPKARFNHAALYASLLRSKGYGLLAATIKCHCSSVSSPYRCVRAIQL